MMWQSNVYEVPLLVAAFISVGLALFMWGRRRSPGAAAFAALLILIAEWSLTDALQYANADLSSILFWDKLVYLGSVSVPVAYLIFVLLYTGRTRWLRARVLCLSSLVPIITVLLRWTNSTQQLIYAESSLVTSWGFSILKVTYGSWFYVYVAYSYILVLFGTAVLVRQFLGSRDILRRQSAILIACALAPLAVSFGDVFPNEVYPFDWTPVAFTFTGLGIFWAVFHFRLFELMPVAREAIVQGMGDGVIVLDTSNRILDINPAGEEMFGCEPAEVLGQPAADFLRRRDLDAQYLAKGSSEIVLNVGGVRRYFDLNFSSLQDKQGRLVGQIGVMRDVTERKRMEDALKESEVRFRELADLLPQIVFETDENGILTFFNRVGFSLTGYSAEELRSGFNASKVFPPEEAKRAMEGLGRALRGEQTDANEYNLLRKDGTRFPVMIHVSPVVRNSKPAGLRGMIVDMTERKEMESRLLKTEHLAAIGETASMVAHDLRNPLQGITMAAYILKDESLAADQKSEMLRLIESNVEYADAIVRDLMDYARKIQLVLAVTTPKEITVSALSTVRIPSNVKVQDLSLELPTINVDRDRMKRVFINLMENAIDAMPRGGTLIIATKQADDCLEVTISDTGTGISNEIMENLWKPLQTTKAKGLGLGLPIVKRIIDAHGGSISVATKIGKGTTITIRLPIEPTAVKAT